MQGTLLGRVVTLLCLCSFALPAPAAALEVVVAAEVSATTGSGARVRGAHLLCLREWLPGPDRAAGRVGVELAGSPTSLLSPEGRGGVSLGALLSPWRNVRLGAGALAQRGTLDPTRSALRAGFELQSGVVLPLGPGAGLDLTARYACLTRMASAGPTPDRFAERYWTVTAGVAFDW